MIKEAALKTKGSDGFRRMLASKSFKKSSTSLCDAIAMLVDPATMEPILANRFFPLDKGNGEVRPIGVGDVIRRIIAK